MYRLILVCLTNVYSERLSTDGLTFQIEKLGVPLLLTTKSDERPIVHL